MSREETSVSIEMAFGVWGTVDPSYHVLDGGPHPPMVRGNLGGGFLPIEKHWDCVLPYMFSDVYHRTVNDAELL